MARRPHSTDVRVSRPLGRDAAAAVFARAAELDIEWTTANGGDDGLDEEELVEIGANAGLSPAAVRQAVAELHGGALVPTGREGALALGAGEETWIGPRCVVAQRVVPLSPRRARGAADRFLREQLFEVARDSGGRSIWRRRDNLAAKAQRVVSRAFRNIELDGVVAPVALAVVEEPGSEGTRCLVRFEADLAPVRSGLRAAIGGVAVTTGLLGGGLAAAIAGPEILFLLAGVPFGGAAAGSGIAVGRQAYRRHHERATTCLEGFLDRLEQGHA